MRSDTLGLQPTTLIGRDGATEDVVAEQLGFCSSATEGKDRWFEVTIYRDDRGGYIVHTVGKSTRPGDRDLCRIVHTSSPWEIIEVLTVTHRGETYMPRPSIRAVAQAAEMDDRIREAYLKLVA